MTSDVGELQKQLRQAKKTIEKLKEIAVNLKVAEKQRDDVIAILVDATALSGVLDPFVHDYKETGVMDVVSAVSAIVSIACKVAGSAVETETSETQAPSNDTVTQPPDSVAQPAESVASLVDTVAQPVGNVAQLVDTVAQSVDTPTPQKDASSLRAPMMAEVASPTLLAQSNFVSPVSRMERRPLSRCRMEATEIEPIPPPTSEPPLQTYKTPVRSYLLDTAGSNDSTSASNRTIEKLQAEVSRFKEEALGARDNLRMFAEIKEQEIEGMRHQLTEVETRCNLMQQRTCEYEDSIAFLETELNIKKATLERAEIQNAGLAAENEALQQKCERLEQLRCKRKPMIRESPLALEINGEPRPIMLRLGTGSTDKEELELTSVLVNDASSRPIESCSETGLPLVESSSSLTQPPPPPPPLSASSPTLIVANLALDSPNEGLEDMDPGGKGDVAALDILLEKDSEIQKLVTEKAQAISMLRAKDLVIEKLHRRIKNMETSGTLDGAISRMASRESKLERELSKLRSKNEYLTSEIASLKEKIDGQSVDQRDWMYLREAVPKFLRHYQKGETEMARALLPVVCSILRLSNDDCTSILSTLSIPPPRTLQ
eukprot:Blabericola_migrator_1__1187@NODE_1303_length_4852_cov_204_626123_g877_i0_p1_GENE_NODE_1303_length_4852_cov_204_626123_g877_i0NODE_1303_length_4852_cov_204_626123_g877_i0_p1_ORF_typecomplete_len603_score119_43HOOK/PF05622_12/1_6e02HOOK/PF05622_12/0_0037HOOK/PF05622_12/0_012ATG16/PF08614_11/1_2e02ATG16/PF08614_11/0_043ATG16/PF08614_11/0_08AAA_13/PF13166_6/1_8e02AAA_13/PF13166_6/0_0048AAA_13/PF13166_6/0_062Golgin_A5/PF09787_9/5_1e02Golgin_A5/PF09787_9/0_0001Golgin_A5/PF09787_9/5_9GRIP/PF01465_20/0